MMDNRSNDEKREAVAWLRGAFTSILEVTPVSYWQKKKTGRLLSQMPDWLMSNWATTLSVDYLGGCTRYPDMPAKANSEAGRNLAQQYLEALDAVAIGNCLDQLCESMMKSAQAGSLPADSEMIERHICALALAGCTAEGSEFAESARGILGDADSPNHPLIDYQLALERGDRSKIEALDAALAGGRCGSWVAERLTEFKRFLGLEPPHFTIHHGERTPQWDLLWRRIFTGGENGQ